MSLTEWIYPLPGKKIIKRLEELNLLEKTEEIIHNVSFSDRTKAVIEPYLSEQWFVSMKELSKPALEVVKSGKIKFYPERYTKVYYHWMENIRDWCISRQLWWGHQIPIWYHKTTNEIYCEINPPEDNENWIQDEDVLDTWFSSWLWPLSVFGWENSEKDKSNENLKYYYPTDFLSTAPEIIFLWVARMIMAGMEYMKEIPFSEVYFHSTVRDGKGVKMSKSLGNFSDAIELMDKYGTDALRFTIVYLAPLGNDVLFDEEKTQIGRNFVTKLWNAGRFLLMMKDKIKQSEVIQNEKYKQDLIDIWIESRYNSVLENADKFLKDYRLNEYTKIIYNFVWSDYCDWYIELMKIKVNEYPEYSEKIINDAINYYENILKLLHPVIPYVTEELWHLMKEGRDDRSISFESIPLFNKDKIDSAGEIKFEKVKEISSAIRNLKSLNNIPASNKSDAYIKSTGESENLISEFKNYIKKLCNLEKLESVKDINEENNYGKEVVGSHEIFLSLVTLQNSKQHKDKLIKDADNLKKYLAGLDSKLSNDNFLSKATQEIIIKEKEKQEEARLKLEKLLNLIK